jgi:hypothetical protein
MALPLPLSKMTSDNDGWQRRGLRSCRRRSQQAEPDSEGNQRPEKGDQTTGNRRFLIDRRLSCTVGKRGNGALYPRHQVLASLATSLLIQAFVRGPRHLGELILGDACGLARISIPRSSIARPRSSIRSSSERTARSTAQLARKACPCATERSAPTAAVVDKLLMALPASACFRAASALLRSRAAAAAAATAAAAAVRAERGGAVEPRRSHSSSAAPAVGCSMQQERGSRGKPAACIAAPYNWKERKSSVSG